MCLFFDCYGTLVKLDQFGTRLRDGFVARGFALDDAALNHATHCEMRHYMSRARHAVDEASRDALRQECARVMTRELRAAGQSERLTHDIVAEVLFASIVFRLYPEVEEVLHLLRAAGARLAVVSNWDFSLARELDRLGIGHFFDFVLTSAQAGLEKPDPAIFEAAVAQARTHNPALAINRCCYIGDHYVNDVLGARRAGLCPLWLVREQRDLTSGETAPEPDDVPQFQTLRELPAWLATQS